MDIVVLGAGAWGTALAIAAARLPGEPHRVTLWARDGAQVAAMRAARENTRYLPGVALPPGLLLAGDDASWPPEALSRADLVIVATPMAALRGMLERLASTPHRWPGSARASKLRWARAPPQVCSDMKSRRLLHRC